MIYGEKVPQGIRLTFIIKRNAINIEFHKAPETLFAVDKYAEGLACNIINNIITSITLIKRHHPCLEF